MRKQPITKFLPFVGIGAILLGAIALFLFARALGQSDQLDLIENARPDVIKIEVSVDGLYRLSLDDLQDTGLAIVSLNIENLRLSKDGRTIPYLVDEDEPALIFYGQQSDSRYSRYGTYLLETGEVGQAMTAVAADGPDNALSTIPQLLHLEQNTLYDGRARFETPEQNDIQGPWYWDTLQVQSQLPLSFELATVSSESALIRLSLWGATHDASIENDHDFDVILNGQSIGTIRFDGETHHQGELTIPPGHLQAGENELILDNAVQGAALVDIMRLDWIDIIYPMTAVANNDHLHIQGVNGTVTADGFSGQPLVFDVSDPETPTLLTDWNYEGETADIPIRESQAVIAVGPDGYLSPFAVSNLRTTSWRNPDNQAELLIVTTDQLAPSLDPFVEARQGQGLQSAVVPVEEIYDEFGFGRPSPEAITNFARYTLENWAEPKPKYLFLVGEASYDYQDFLGNNPQNVVPSLIVPVSFSGETVSDARLADVDGDFKPDLAVGRWPVDSPEAVAALIERTLAYETGQASERVIFAADGTSAEFSGVSDRVLQQSDLDETAAEKLYGATAETLTSSWNEGAWLLSYVGHGSLDRWGQEDVFSTDAVSGLQTITPPPIVMQLTCLTGFFAHPTISSLSEQMLLHEAGPVLIVSATSLTLSASQTPFGINLVNELQNPERLRMGDAVRQAKLALDVSDSHLREISDTFGLLGDPSALIVRP